MTSILKKYIEYLPLTSTSDIDGIGEGNTPLVRSSGIAGNARLYFKMEQLNPTGSFKDRFAAVETELMKQKGIRAFIATSSGNTGAALAAYGARHGIRCLLFVNEITPASKLDQMLVYGAEVFRVKDFGVSSELSAPIFERLQQLAVAGATRLVISAYRYSPEGMEGVKTIAYELVEQFGEVPDHIFVPVGGGGLLSGIWRGFKDLKERRLIESLPKLNAVQPELNNTVVTSINENAQTAREVRTTTSISGLAVQVDIDASLAVRSVSESGGRGYLVSDKNVFDIQSLLAQKEGVYVEPAGAVSTAGYLRALGSGFVREDESAVCILTGHGLKTASSISATLKRPVEFIEIGDIGTGLLADNKLEL
jgi:threonine synthase